VWFKITAVAGSAAEQGHPLFCRPGRGSDRSAADSAFPAIAITKIK